MRHMRHRYFVPALAMMVLVACDGGGTEPPLAARLELGQSLTDSAGALRTIELVPDAAYMIAVVNTSATEAGEAGFTLHGALGPGGVAGPPATELSGAPAAAPVLVPAPVHAASRAPSPAASAPTTLRTSTGQPAPDLHVQLLDRDRHLFRRLRAPSGIAAARRRAAAMAADAAPRGPSPISLRVGDLNTLTIRDIRADTDCTQGTAVQARTVYLSNKLVILEDVTAPLAGEEDDFFRQMGEEYDALTYPEVVENFGDPLALLPGYAPTGRVVVLLSPILNQDFGGVAGFVSGCDFYPRSEAPIGNQQLIFYDFVATGLGDRASWEAFIRSVAAHETKHLASYATRFTNGATELEHTWLEEATAQMSAEIWDRNFTHATWKQTADFAHTVACDPPLAACGAGYPQNLLQHFDFLYQYLDNFEAESPTGSTFEASYGGAWSFVRWVADQYASSESGFLRSVIGDPNHLGLSNLAAHSGRSAAELLVGWTLATAADEYTQGFRPIDARYQLPSWNQRDIYANLHRYYLGFPKEYPLAPRAVDAGAFDVRVSGIHAGGGAVFTLRTGPSAAGPQRIEVRDASGNPLAAGSTLRLGIVRVQ